MSGSVIFTFHPEIQLLLQKQFQQASGSILPFKKWVEQTLLQKLPFQLFSEEEQRLCVKKLREGVDSLAFDGIDDLALSLFKSLKDKQISENSFLKGVESSRLMLPKKKLLLGLARWYSAYLKKRGESGLSPQTIDEEDLYKLAISLYPSQSRLLELDKAVVLALKLTSLELKLLRLLEEEGTVVEMISIDSFNPKRVPDIFVVEAESLHLEVESVLKDMSFQFEFGTRECLIYCFQSWMVYRQILSAASKKHGISLDSIPILPWEDNTIVLGEKGLVYVVGVSEEKSDGVFDFLLPEEKEHLNHCLKSNLFELPYERKERTRQLLRYLASCSQRLKLSYVGKGGKGLEGGGILSEFLEDYKYKVDEPFQRNGSSYNLYCKPFPSEMDLPSTYSVRSLNQYQRCPYGFFLKECLGFYPKSLKQDRLTAAEEGILYHDILFRFFSEGCQELEEVVQESFQVFTKKTGKNISLPQRLKMEKAVFLFLAEEKEWQKTSRFKPRYFEQSFEMELKQGDESIFLRGKIDRVDVDEERKEFIIIDYKTGGELPSAKEVMAGRDFQLVMYAIAMEERFLRGYRPFGGFCYHVKKIKSKKLFEVLSGDEWEALKKITLHEVFSIISEIRKKRFVGAPENCYESCELRDMCAVNGRDNLRWKG